MLRLEIIKWVATGAAVRVRGDSERKRGEILRPVNGPPFASLEGKLDDVKGGEAEATSTAKAHRPTPACATLRAKAGGCSLGALAVGGGVEVGKAVAERPQSKALRAGRLESALWFWRWVDG